MLQYWPCSSWALLDGLPHAWMLCLVFKSCRCPPVQAAGGFERKEQGPPAWDLREAPHGEKAAEGPGPGVRSGRHAGNGAKGLGLGASSERHVGAGAEESGGGPGGALLRAPREGQKRNGPPLVPAHAENGLKLLGSGLRRHTAHERR